MKRYLVTVLGVALASVLSAQASPVAGQVCPSGATVEDPDLAQFFDAWRVTGTFVLLDTEKQACIRFNPERARIRFLPASTFKIFNTMVALDEGSIADAETVVKWDGVDRGSAAWNRDQNMRTAFRSSTVWFYQELARRTGERRMKDWLEREAYGNADPSGGIDQFWLNGGLAISADEQVELLSRLNRQQLGFSARAQRIAAELLVWERAPAYTLRGKTGWTTVEGRHLGWLVGSVEKSGTTWIYAMNFESVDPEFRMPEARETILRQILGRLGILPAT
jgi:beta-lactamase class D